jgi:excisionase family DNA binding protein
VLQAAEAIGVSPTTIRRLLKQGVLHEVRHGKRGFAVLYADLRRLVEARVGTYHPARYNRDFNADPIRRPTRRHARVG